MNRIVAAQFLVCASFVLLPKEATADIAIDTVIVGNAGNANDPRDGDSLTPGIQNFGAVAYNYRVGTTEVTNAQYAAFLNAKAKSDPLNLWYSFMGFNGITRT